jgi:hypothetical protein
MDCILFHGKFDGGLSIMFLRNRATMHIKIGVQNRSVSKSSNFQKPPTERSVVPNLSLGGAQTAQKPPKMQVCGHNSSV